MNEGTGLTIRCLGGLHIWLADTAVTHFASRKADALLVYLACNPRPHPRETLATLLWPDNDQTRALANLSVILTSLRKQLDSYLVAERHTVSFNYERPVVLDVAQFEQAIAQAQPHGGKITRTVAAQLQTAVSLYKGDFLAGFNLRGVPEFEAWVLLEQERLRQLMLDALADLITFHQQRGQFSEGIQYAQQLLALDPLQEETHRQLMQLYVLDNQRPAALAQYEQCSTILDEELGVEPDEETVALYEAIRDDKVTRRQGDKVTLQQTVTLSPGHPVTLSQKHNLPAATTAFIGREVELAQVESWLSQPDGRLLTIVGPGGMGKTRLAQEAARTQLGTFADGVWYVSLVPQTDLNEVVTAVAEAIQLALTGKENLPTQLLNHLKPLEMLLVLDNLEHLLTGELRDFLSQLTQQAPELRLITTSRERLRLQAERLLELGGLSFPVGGNRLSVIGDPSTAHRSPLTNNRSPFTDYPAIQLFANLAQRVQADFDLARQETAVVQLCQLVGGLPLALELAATWTRVLTVAEIVAEIQRGLDALTATLHDLPERHRSLRAVIESSWRLLPVAEQTLFRKLAVFRGGFTRTAAQQVAGATLPQLMSLADRSFLRLDADQRFRRHPLLLQFAQEQLSAHFAEKDQAEAEHAHFFAGLVQAQEAALKGSETREALELLEADLENIRAAWQWGLARVDTAVLDPLITGIGRFYASRGRPLEGALLFEAGLQSLAQSADKLDATPLIAKMQVELGYFWDQNGRLPEADALLKRADETLAQYELHQIRVNCLRILGVVSSHKGSWDDALAYLTAARELCAAHGEPDQLLPILNELGNVAVSQAKFAEARAYFEEAVALAEQLGNTLRLAILRGNMGIIANRQKDFAEAIRQWRLAQQGFAAHNHELGLANVTFNIAMALHGLERHEEALADIQKAYALLEKLGQQQGMAGGLGVMGMIYHKMGKRRAARRHLNGSLRLAHATSSANLAISSIAELASLAMSGGDLPHAAYLLFFILGHPATSGTTRQNTEKLLDELRAELPPEVMMEMETAVTKLTLDDIVAQLTGEN
ncbi:MAG: tetratricopeptide repeat protein [Ardenticatenaceae bacterium]|nr:tetratricopeptide repeat protein [Ardenticatenaceae bacterium]MCB8947982.1 tetratricopeptide repeat protein [Ardenticatenaceae bacterium]